MIHWVPERRCESRANFEEFDEVIERMNAEADGQVPVRTCDWLWRVELVELIYMVEAGMNQRVVEYVKYSIYTRNQEKLGQGHRMLLNVKIPRMMNWCL